MKKLLFFGILLFFSHDAHAVYGTIQYIVPINAITTQYNTAYYNSEIMDYVAGGTVFTFPSGIFTMAPTVRAATVLKNAVYSPAEMYVPVIVSISASSTTIRINKIINGGTVVEAATDDVTLHLLAVGI